MEKFYIMSIFSLIIGYILDLIFGDPTFLYHPVIFIGKVISKTEKILRTIFKKNNKSLIFAGLLEVLVVILISTLIPTFLLYLSYLLHPIVYFIVSSFMSYQILATKCLKDCAMAVYKPCVEGNLESSRYQVSMIVGRDTSVLDLKGVMRAAIESVAESSSDGVLAPMFYMALGGPVLGFFYKAINTMDSMIAYKNEKYIYFGRVAAKLDDFFNLIPSRMCGLLIILSSFFLKYNALNALKIFKRDRYKHESPNSAQCEAPMAGALSIRLAGDAVYEGEVLKKDYLGDPLKEVEPEDIKRSIKILYMTSFLGLVLFTFIKAIIWMVIR